MGSRLDFADCVAHPMSRNTEPTLRSCVSPSRLRRAAPGGRSGCRPPAPRRAGPGSVWPKRSVQRRLSDVVLLSVGGAGGRCPAHEGPAGRHWRRWPRTGKSWRDPGVGDINVEVLEIGDVAGCDAETIGLGGAGYEGIAQLQHASGTLRLCSELGCPLRRCPIQG